jgi:hypothetical protein
VRAEVEACDVCGVAALERLRERDPHPGVARIDRHARPNRHRDVDEGAAGGGDRRRWCRRMTGRPPGDRPLPDGRQSPKRRRRRNSALCGKSMPSRFVVVDVEGRGRIDLSQRRRSSSPTGVRRAPGATAAGASAREPDRPPRPRIPVQRRTFHGPACVPVRRTRVERWTVASGGGRRPVTSTMPYGRCIRCGVRCFSAARWSNVDQCGVCGADLPRRPVDCRAGVAPASGPHRVSRGPGIGADEREVAVMASGGGGPTDRAITRRVAALAVRSA